MIEVGIYGITIAFVVGVLWYYIRKGQRQNSTTQAKIDAAKEIGTFEPISLHPHINLSSCMGSGACIRACPEKDILGIIDGKATIINAASCIGHGACFLACPVDAITLRIGTAERGVELPHVMPDYQSNVPGIFIAGELGGMGLIKNAAEQGIQAVTGISKYLSTQRSQPDSCDLLIVGAGPAGIAAALKAVEGGLNVRIVDQESFGGTVFTFPRQKVVMTQPMDLPGYGKVKLVNTSKQELLEVWRKALGTFDLKVEEHMRVLGIEKGENGFTVQVSDREDICAQSVLLAIGRRGTPRKLGVPGEQLPKVTYQLIEPELFKSQNIMVVGGGDSAVESALLLSNENSVILSYRKSAFARIKPDNRTRIEAAVAENRIQVEFDSEVVEIHEDFVILRRAGGSEALPNDHVFVFAGGELPNVFLREAGIEVKAHFGKTVRKHKK